MTHLHFFELLHNNLFLGIMSMIFFLICTQVPQEISFADSFYILVSLDNLCWMLRHLFVYILLATIMPIIR